MHRLPVQSRYWSGVDIVCLFDIPSSRVISSENIPDKLVVSNVDRFEHDPFLGSIMTFLAVILCAIFPLIGSSVPVIIHKMTRV